MNAKLLLIEDDVGLGETLFERLSRDYEVQWAQNAASARKLFAANLFDLLIIDVGLPDESGFKLARELNLMHRVPFLFLTAMNTAEDRLEGFELGAEDYIPKPFHLKELLLRVQNAIGRKSSHSQIVIENVRIDFAALSVTASDGSAALLQPRDATLLEFLIKHSPRAVSRDEILDQIWGEDRYPSQRTIDNAVVRLRQALGSAAQQWLRSVRGVGYQWLAPQMSNPSTFADSLKKENADE